MILSDREIAKRINNGELSVKPFRRSHLQPSSLDLTLSRKFLIFRNAKQAYLDTRKPVESYMEGIEIKNDEPLIVHPREFILGATREKVKIPSDLVGQLEGKSSLGRIGIIIHSTAGFFDPGFEGYCTLEISNLSNIPIALYAEMKICQMSFILVTGKVGKPYGHPSLGSKYQNQKGPTASRIHKEFLKK